MQTLFVLSLMLSFVTGAIGSVFHHVALRVSERSFVHDLQTKWWKRDEDWYAIGLWRSLVYSSDDLSEDGVRFRRIGLILWAVAVASGVAAMLAFVTQTIIGT